MFSPAQDGLRACFQAGLACLFAFESPLLPFEDPFLLPLSSFPPGMPEMIICIPARGLTELYASSHAIREVRI